MKVGGRLGRLALAAFLVAGVPAAMRALPASNGRIIFGFDVPAGSGNSTPRTKAFGVNRSVASEHFDLAAATAAGASQTWLVDRASPTRDEHLAGYVSGDKLYLLRRSGSTGAWSNEWNVTVGGDGVNGRRFDIGYLSQSGKAVVVYSTNLGASLQLGYRSWDGASWTAETRFTSSALTTDTTGNGDGIARMVKLASRRDADELAVTVASGGNAAAPGGTITTLFWNGSSWGDESSHASRLFRSGGSSGLVVGDSDCFDHVYDSAGNFLVYFANWAGNRFTRVHLAAGGWQARSGWLVRSVGAGSLHIAAAADSASNQVLAVANDGASGAVDVAVWNGTAFTSGGIACTPSETVVCNNQVTTAAAPAAVNQKTVAAAWVSRGSLSQGVVLWATAATNRIDYALYDPTSGMFSNPRYWTFGTTGALPGAKAWMAAEQGPLSTNSLLLTFSDVNQDLWAKRASFVGKTSGGENVLAWSDADAGSRLNAASLPATTTQSFAFAHDRLAWATATVRGRLLYSDGSGTPQSRAYTSIRPGPEVYSLSSPALAGAPQPWLVTRTCPTRDEQLSGYVSGGTLYVLRRSGATGWKNEWSVAVGGDDLNGRRFDIAYLSQSGKAAVVYSKNAARALGYRTWDGAAWSVEATFAPAFLSGVPAMVKLASRRGADELAATVADVGGALTTLLWNGTSWSGEPGTAHTAALYKSSVVGDCDAFDHAYDSAGNLLVFFASATGPDYTRPYLRAGGWQASAVWQNHAPSVSGVQIAAAADPNSNRVLAVGNSSNPFGIGSVDRIIWDGSAFGLNIKVAGSAAPAPATVHTKNIAAAWDSVGSPSTAVAMWTSAATNEIDYATWTSASPWTNASATMAWTFGAVGPTAPAGGVWMNADIDAATPNTFTLSYSDANGNLLVKKGIPGQLAFGGSTSLASGFDLLASPTATGAQPTWVVDRASPVRDEHLAGYVTSGGMLYVMRRNGATGAWTSEWNLPAVPVVGGDGVTGRRFDIAYLSSGNAVVVYSKNAAQSLGYRVWNGLTWSNEATFTAARLNVEPTMVKLASRRGVTEVAATVVDTGGASTTLFWNGATWSGEPATAHGGGMYRAPGAGGVEPGPTVGDSDAFDAAYDSSGNFLIFYSSYLGKLYYRVYSRATSTWASFVVWGPQIQPTAGGLQLSVAADPASNKILAAANEGGAGGAIYAAVWDGTTVGPFAQVTSTATPAATYAKTVATAWLNHGGTSAGIVLWGTAQSSQLDYAYTFNGNNFSTDKYWTFGAVGSNTLPGPKAWMNADVDPAFPDHLLLTFADTGRNVWAKQLAWVGGNAFSWSDADGGAPVNASFGAFPGDTVQAFSFAYDQPATTSVGTGTGEPTLAALPGGKFCPSPVGGATPLDAFTVQSGTGTDAVRAVTVSFSTGFAAWLSKVEITDALGAIVYGSVDNPVRDDVSVLLSTPILATTTATQYLVRITTKDNSALPSGFATPTAKVTGILGVNSNPPIVSDTAYGFQLTNVNTDSLTAGSMGAGDGSVTLGWGLSGAPAVVSTSVLILRNTASVTDVPAEGQGYSAPGTIGTSAVIYSGPASSHGFNDTSVVNGTSYYYKVFGRDACGNYTTGTQFGPAAPQAGADNRLTTGALSVTLDGCSATLGASFSGDANGNAIARFEYEEMATQYWSTMYSVSRGPSLFSAKQSLLAGKTYTFSATFTDADGIAGTNPLVSAAVTIPACTPALELRDPGQTGPLPVPAGSSGVAVGKFNLSASAGTVTLQSLGFKNTGTALPGSDVLQLQLLDDASGALLGTATFDGVLYQFTGLAADITAGSPRTFRLVLALANSARVGGTLIMYLSTDNISPAPSYYMVVIGPTCTITSAPAAGSTSVAAPSLQILNPSDGKVVSGPTFRVQVRVYNPGGIAALTGAPTLSTDGGTNWVTLFPNGNYPTDARSGVYETTASRVAGTYTLVAKASNTAGQSATSSQVTITVNEKGGDGALLARDNSGQLCADCHALMSHSSEATVSRYGAWSTSCRDCHTPHSTTNLYLVNPKITPPSFNVAAGAQGQRTVKFYSITGDSNGGSSSYVNNDGSGPCQACHTRTQDQDTGQPRWRNTLNLDSHYTAAVGTQRCTDCHLHVIGFAADSPGHTDCVRCHNAIFAPMNGTSGHHHYLASGNSGLVARSGTTVYPTAAPTASQTDPNRSCLMCHVDHDLFRPEMNAAGGRGMNLRTDIALTPTLSANLSNKDFDAALPNGGICLSCHKGALTKAYVAPGGSTTTPVIDKIDYAGSAHGYAGPPAAFKGVGTAQFVSNCSKCHSDTQKKRYQKFDVTEYGLHDSSLTSLLTPVALGNPGAAGTDPLGDKLCLQCHRRTSDLLGNSFPKLAAGRDLYGAQGMSSTSELVDAVLGYTYGHVTAAQGAAAAHQAGEGGSPSDGSLSGAKRHVTCRDCHGPHGASPVGNAKPGTVTGFVSGGATESWNPNPDSGATALRCGGGLDMLTDAAAAWPVNGRVGWTVKILSGTGAGSTSTIYANTGSTLSAKFDCAATDPNPPYLPAASPPPASGSTYVLVDTGAANAGDFDGPMKGAWGLEPAWPPQPPPPIWNDAAQYDGSFYLYGTRTAAPFANGDKTLSGPVYNAVTTWNRTAKPRRSGSVCIKCHSAYAYGSTPPNTPSGAPNTPYPAVFGNTPGGAMLQGDTANEFNPNNLSHHAVFARGKNQPLVSSDTVVSNLNPAWPRFIGNGGSVNVDVQDVNGKGVVTLHGTTWPSPVLPGWFIYLGSSQPGLVPAHDEPPRPVSTCQGCPGACTANVCTPHLPDTYVTAGWYEVSAIDRSANALTLDRSALARAGTGKDFLLTAGLANTFVPPFGPWSTLQCFDCHGSDGSAGTPGWPSGTTVATNIGSSVVSTLPAKPGGAPDPFGPHGSGTKWNLRKLTLKTYPMYVGNGSDPTAVVTVTQTFRAAPLPAATNVCLNCHRWETYGDFRQGPSSSAFNRGLSPSDMHYSRVDHPPPRVQETARGDWFSNHPYLYPNQWGIICMTCHGGARGGAIHGENLGHGAGRLDWVGCRSDRWGACDSYSGTRMLAGSKLTALTRPSMTATGACLLKGDPDAVDVSNYSGGSVHGSIYPTMGWSNYDYQSGVDPP